MNNSEECKLMIKNNRNQQNNNINEKEDNKLFDKKTYFIIIIFILFLLFFINLKLYKKELTIGMNEILNIQHIIKNQNISSELNNTIINDLNNYISLCENGTLLYEIKKFSKIPKITVLISVYNAEKTIKATIRSIQNQNMQDIEILLIDDNSIDNSLQIIEELQKEDKRIKLLKNKQNKGTLYAMSIGALNSKGKYLMTLHHDDLFINNIFNICLEEAKNNNFDIIEFSGYNTYNTYFLSNNYNNSLIIPYYLQFKKDGLIVKQPELSSFMYQKQNNSDDYILIDGLIWGKFINSMIYKKSVNLLGDIIFNEKVCWTADKIVNFALFKTANSFKFINVKGIIHYVSESNNENILNDTKRDQIFHDEFINVMNVLNITKNSDNEKFILVEFKNAWKLYSSKLNKNNKKFAMDLYKDILFCKNILDSEKQELSNLVKNTLIKENELF